MGTKRTRAAQPGRTRGARREPGRSARRELNARREAEKTLLQAEERFKSLLKLSSDWYWEQDESFRFTVMIGGASERHTGLPMREHIGRTRWDHPALNLTEEDWAKHRALLERHEPFRDFEIRRPDRDGKPHWASVSGEPIFDAEGRFRGYRGIGREISERKRGEQLLRLEHQVARSLSEAESAASSLRAVMRAVCEAEGWACGRYFRVDQAAGLLRFEAAWHVPEPAVEQFAARSRGLAFRPGEGLAGGVWQTGEPAWSADTSRDPRVKARSLAEGSGIRGAFLFAVISEGKTVGVFAFSSQEVREPDERLLQTVRVVGGLIGQFLKRKQAEEESRESEARFRALTELSSDWYWEQDAEYRFTRAEGRGVAAGDALRGWSLIGKRRWETGVEIEGGWDAHRALLEARKPFRDVVMWRTLPDGSRNYVSVSGEPILDADGRFAGYRGIGRIITARKRAEQLLRLEHAVARRLAEAATVSEGMQDTMRAICETENWDCAEFWKVDDSAGVMRLAEHWISPGEPRAARFVERSKGVEFKRGVGLAGSVWASAEPLWIPDVLADPRILRKDLAQETGLRGALFFPIVYGGEVLGVLDFTCRELRPPDERLQQALQVIGAQIGQFLERVKAEDQMRRFRLAMDQSVDMILLIDRATMRYVDVNAAACKMLGYTKEELIAMSPMDVVPGLRREELERDYEELIANPSRTSGMKTHYRRRDGTLLPFESTRRALRSGDSWFIVAISRDIRERLAADEALRESEARFRSLTQMSSDFFWETDDLHRFTLFVQGSGASPARPEDELLGKTPWELPSLKPDAAGWEAHRAKLEGHLPFRDFEIARPAPDGVLRYVSVSGKPRFGADGSFLGYRGVGRDITDIALARERIASLAYSDPLTGLANRTSLAPALEQAIERARRRKSRLAAMFVDLDGFKPVNDTYGHDAGDRLLVELAGRLRSHLRASDLVARLGGDEFFVVLEEISENKALETVARKLLLEIARPFSPAPGHEAALTASIGVSFFPDDAGDAETLMKHADMSMYDAKQCGKNCFRFFGAPGPG